MSRTTARAVVRSVAGSVAIATGLGLAAVAVGTTPAQSAAPAAAPAGDCAVAFPVDELAKGDAVTGLTVSEGTTPEGFTGEVLGVLADGVAPGVDMVMVRLSSPEIDRAGIWQGMSGSPVYAADGRLIGAVGYGLAMGRSPVAGVTPFEQMDDYLDAEPAGVVVDRRARATRRFEQLPMPLGVAGVGARRVAAAADRPGAPDWLPRAAYAVGRAGAADVTADDLVAGGNMAASIVHGDITMAGVGTVTSVCEDRVVGFGHPMEWLGETTLGLHPAETIYVQEDLVSSFKVANLGAPVGTVTDDRRTGITGTLGVLPESTEVTSTLSYDGRSRTGVSHVSVQSPDALASTTFYSLLANHETLVDGPLRGTEEVAWTVTGTDVNAEPFELTYDDLFASSDLTWDVGFGAGDFVYFLSRVPGISIDSITTTGALRDGVETVRIGKVEVRQGGEWVKAGRRSVLFVRGGGTLAARITLRTPSTSTSEGTTSVLPVRLDVPRSFAGGRRPAVLQVGGGSRYGIGPAPSKVDQLEKWLAEQVRSDEIVVALRRGRASERVTLGPVGGVVRGGTFSLVEVR